jgi:glucosyl-3-phosphoglycerate synthase
MEYVQEGVTTLHDFGGAAPAAPSGRATVVVPLTEREHAAPAADGVLATLESVGPERVVVPLHASPDRVGELAAWLEGFDLPTTVLWCDGPELNRLLAEAGVAGPRGKGRDVWLALGVAGESDYVVVHDADAKSYEARHVPKLLFPLAHGHAFSKGYYTRVEDDRLYGRLFRLFYRPLVEAMAAAPGETADVVEFLGDFRYALAGEFATTGALARRLRVQRGWGLEVGTLGEAYRLVGADGTAQVDLGVHQHDHRAVTGPSGLSGMAEQVAEALFRAVEDNGGDPEYATLEERYRRAAGRLVDAYEADAAFNDLSFDRVDERRQVDAYAGAIDPPGADTRLPAWREVPLDPDAVVDAAAADLEAATAGTLDVASDD